MKFEQKNFSTQSMILANTHFAARSYDCSALTDKADSNNIIAAGTVVPSNDAKAIGVLLYDVDLNENPNGAVVYHGSILADKLPEEMSAEAKTALPMIELR